MNSRKIAWISFHKGCRKPYIVQVFKDRHLVTRQPLSTRTAAEDWIQLNHPTAEITDKCPTYTPQAVQRAGLLDTPIESLESRKARQAKELPKPRLVKQS
jgi:hypothetical protein